MVARAAKPFPKATTAFVIVPEAVTIACTLSATVFGGVDPPVDAQLDGAASEGIEEMVARQSD